MQTAGQMRPLCRAHLDDWVGGLAVGLWLEAVPGGQSEVERDRVVRVAGHAVEEVLVVRIPHQPAIRARYAQLWAAPHPQQR